MRIASGVAASIQQAQFKDLRESNRNVQDKNIQDNNRLDENRLDERMADRTNADRITQIKDSIRNGTYKLDLAATADMMARSLLNV